MLGVDWLPLVLDYDSALCVVLVDYDTIVPQFTIYITVGDQVFQSSIFSEIKALVTPT